MVLNSLGNRIDWYFLVTPSGGALTLDDRFMRLEDALGEARRVLFSGVWWLLMSSRD